MYTIALIAQKGGTGKTTLGISLAVAAEQAGKTTLIVDLDPQSSACNWKDRRQGETPIVTDSQPPRLAALLSTAEEKGVEFVIIDTPARLEQSALVAAKCADLVVIPCRASPEDLQTIPSTQEIIRLAAGDKPTFAVLNALPSSGDRHEQAKKFFEQLKIPVCPVTIGNRVAFGDASTLGKTPQEYDPRGKAAEEILEVYKHTIRILGMLKPKQQKQEAHAHEKSRQIRPVSIAG
jgi:chromosome partitioning protein